MEWGWGERSREGLLELHDNNCISSGFCIDFIT
jgi:hypothetical protein